MPRTNIDYSNTIIYKLCCKDISITEIYVGHTTDMRRRKYCHKSDCENKNKKVYNLNVYQFIRDNGGWDNWDMVEVERYNAIDGYDASKRERYWIEELKATLNMIIPARNVKERYELNKEIIKEYKKEYCEINKEIIVEDKKKYYIENKQKLNEISKKYYDSNKETLNEKRKEKNECECGCIVCKIVLKRHLKSKKHINLMSQKSKSSIIT